MLCPMALTLDKLSSITPSMIVVNVTHGRSSRMQLVSLRDWWYMRNPQSNLTEFCDERNLSDALRQAFLTYCKSMFASRYLMSPNGDTINKFVAEMSREQVLDAWN